MKNNKFTVEEKEYLAELADLRAQDHKAYMFKTLSSMFLEKFPGSHSKASIIGTLKQIAVRYSKHKHYTQEQIAWLTEKAVNSDYSDADIALAFDDIFGDSHFQCGHSQGSIVQQLVNIRKNLRLKNEGATL